MFGTFARENGRLVRIHESRGESFSDWIGKSDGDACGV
jgi:hypothetical protein